MINWLKNLFGKPKTEELKKTGVVEITAKKPDVETAKKPAPRRKAPAKKPATKTTATKTPAKRGRKPKTAAK